MIWLRRPRGRSGTEDIEDLVQVQDLVLKNEDLAEDLVLYVLTDNIQDWKKKTFVLHLNFNNLLPIPDTIYDNITRQ